MRRGEVPIVTIDGDEFEYYAAGVEIPGARIADARGYDYRHDAVLDHHPRFRRVIARARWLGELHGFFGALRFAEDADIARVDELVESGAGLGDAESSVIFTVVREALCRSCRTSSLVAAVDTDLPGSSIARQRLHPSTSRCPNCGEWRFLAHIEVFAE